MLEAEMLHVENRWWRYNTLEDFFHVYTPYIFSDGQSGGGNPLKLVAFQYY